MAVGRWEMEFSPARMEDGRSKMAKKPLSKPPLATAAARQAVKAIQEFLTATEIPAAIELKVPSQVSFRRVFQWLRFALLRVFASLRWKSFPVQRETREGFL